MAHSNYAKSIAVGALGAFSIAGALAQENIELTPVVVSATRSEESIAAIPGSVTVITHEEIADQTAISNDLGDILAQKVPGFAPTTDTLSNFGQPLRGRNVSVLIDGVPQSSPLRNFLRDIRSIDPNAVERIEVISGATAIYGNGATGGVLNIITKKPQGKPSFTSEAGLSLSATHPGDSLGGHISQSASGKTGVIDYVVSGLLERSQSFFDADGDRISPNPHEQGGLADLDTVNLLGKIGLDFNQQRLELSVNYFKAKQDTDFINVAGIAGQQKSGAAPGPPPGVDSGTENTVVNFAYTHRDLYGSRLNSQLYYQDYETIFGFSTFFPNGGQSVGRTRKFGGRLDIDTPFKAIGKDGSVLWGLDYVNDRAHQPLVDGRDLAPEVEQNSVGLFAQLEYNLSERWLLRAGVRHEEIALDIDTFTTLFVGNQVQGGELDYDATLFNTGAVFYLTDAINLFANYSEGFSVTEIARELRGTTAASVEQLTPDAEKVDNYEIGIRGDWKKLQASLSVFYSESDGGVTFGAAPDFLLIRSPEEVYGLEASIGANVATRWQVGGTLSLIEGKRDSNNDGSVERFLTGDRIPPAKFTAYVEHQTTPGWRNRLQLLHSGSRDRFPGSTIFGEGEVNSFTTVDLLSRVKAGPGILSFGVENLLNEEYFPPISEFSNLNTSYAAAQGTVIRAQYSLNY